MDNSNRLHRHAAGFVGFVIGVVHLTPTVLVNVMLSIMIILNLKLIIMLDGTLIYMFLQVTGEAIPQDSALARLLGHPSKTAV